MKQKFVDTAGESYSVTYLLSSEGKIYGETSLCFAATLIVLLPAYIAYTKGRSFLLWWIFGAALFIVALPAALVISPNTDAIERRQLQQGDSKKCQYCAELIKREAKVCRYCIRELQPSVQT